MTALALPVPCRPRRPAPSGALDAVLADSGWTLPRLAALVLDGDCLFEAECVAVAAAGAALREAAQDGRIRLPAHLDTAVIAWAVERIASRRIEDGDLAIDHALLRLAEAEAQSGGGEEAQRLWWRAQNDYQRLAETLLADTFDELREFDLCKLFVADRAAYRRCRDLGRRHLAELVGRPAVAAH